ncbi:hypothetical protein Nepgr_023266 [Nepenthes gracilis]|uniref:Dolichyl-diphosphooligosaccharide--protein glycosyltransferase 48 kDa subunit n=1 Tax=Nepenthes gracilis TaxID=150966 RepID=A0AAD3T2Q6_NEPGR|nr:hypothetical protein Nepgr_023266 [Nepenthes gracilis]
MLSPLTKFFTHNCPNVEAILDSENLSNGFLLTDKDQNKAPVLVPVPPLQGLNNSDPATLVVDHNSYAVSNNNGEHTLLATNDFVQPDTILENKKIEAPILFRGVAPLLNPVNNLELKILPVSPYANSANPNTKSLKAPVAIGSSISLVPNVHAKSTIRTLILGSLSMFRDFFLDLEYRSQATQLDLKNLILLWPLEMNSDPPPQNNLGWWCIYATINSSSLEDHIKCKASPGTEDDGVDVSWRRGPSHPGEFEGTRIIGGSTEVVKTCPTCYGFWISSLVLRDGHGAFDLIQGDDGANPFWKLVRDVPNTPERSKLHAKAQNPSYLILGGRKDSVLPVRVLRIGQLAALNVPAGFTTRDGRHH